MRQVGKTYTISCFGRENYDNVVTVNFSLNVKAKTAFNGNLDIDMIVMKLGTLFLDRMFKPHRTLIFLDKIQDCPNARASLKAFALDGCYDVIASESLISLRKNDVPSYSVECEHEIYMDPMDFEKFL